MTPRLLLVPITCLALILHLLWGLLVAVLLFPLLPAALRDALVRVWSRIVLRILGVRLHATVAPGGAPLAAGQGALLVTNHISWLDVFVITAIVPARFVAKSEIARWPVLGRLAAAIDTVFVERGRRHAVAHVNELVVRRLRAGQAIGIFPEGTTTDGTHVLPFHANLVQAAIDAPAPVIPLALQYRQDDQPATAAAYIGDMTLVASIWIIVTTPRLSAHLCWLPALDTAGQRRHDLGRHARDAIARCLDLPQDAPPEQRVSAAR